MRTKLWLTLFVLAFPVYGQNGAPTPSVPVDRPSAAMSRNLISKEDLLIPRRAIRELERSQRDYASGNVRASVRHLENSLSVYPNNLEARNNLGAQYIELHQYDKAVAELQMAIQIDPSALQPFNNLSVAFFRLRRYPDAEATARKALVLEPQNSRSRYALGCALTAENRDTQEAMDMLRASTNEFPDARLVLANTLLRRGPVEEAKRELQNYLGVAGIENKELAERWLAQLAVASASLNGHSAP